ncbi:MAG: HU family DNA-binding protein [Phocaeicola sp.]|uniref:HU family DNA-binding protein n=1 Tax=Phocaeicola sp. TaxID=2773926 RepID=UPI003F9F03A5
MSIFYDFYPSPDLRKDGQSTFNAKFVKNGEINTKELAQLIARRSTMSEADVIGVLTALCIVMKERLMDGNTVKLDNIGSFHVRVKSKKVSRTDEIRAESIETNGITFQVAKSLKDEMRKCDFIKVPTALSHRSVSTDKKKIISDIKLYLENHLYITRRELVGLCGLSNATAYRILKECVKNGMLNHPGAKNAPYYFKN